MYEIGLIAQARKPHLTNDVASDQWVSDKKWAEENGIVAFAGYPLTVRDRLVGVLGMFSRNLLLDETWEALGSVANSIAVGIERKKGEEALLRQWHLFDTALSNTLDFTYTFDLEGRFTYANRALLSLWQKTLDESVGKNFFDLDYPPDLAERLQNQIQHVINTLQVVRDQTPYTSAAGVVRYYEYIFTPVFAADGRVEAVPAQRAISRKSSVRKRNFVRVKNGLTLRLPPAAAWAPGIGVFRRIGCSATRGSPNCFR